MDRIVADPDQLVGLAKVMRGVAKRLDSPAVAAGRAMPVMPSRVQHIVESDIDAATAKLQKVSSALPGEAIKLDLRSAWARVAARGWERNALDLTIILLVCLPRGEKKEPRFYDGWGDNIKGGLRGAGRRAKSVGSGAGSTLMDWGKFSWELQVAHQQLRRGNPGPAWEMTREMGGGLKYMWDNPDETPGLLLDPNGSWRSGDRWRWAGEFLPDLVLTVATAGGGAAARAASAQKGLRGAKKAQAAEAATAKAAASAAAKARAAETATASATRAALARQRALQQVVETNSRWLDINRVRLAGARLRTKELEAELQASSSTATKLRNELVAARARERALVQEVARLTRVRNESIRDLADARAALGLVLPVDATSAATTAAKVHGIGVDAADD